ncbi:hypothetical protein B0T18DRAFT_391280 [Schizothecium vesticola]|uniref:Uncharacterized protein n=1 Tax=Schizothecium vesticola TaxID=314040 RepID=A0AA40EWL7_9PEZI|nr:hypothetical protein B0T18DRAFT_391280 [Schizothecium vesticola]
MESPDGADSRDQRGTAEDGGPIPLATHLHPNQWSIEVRCSTLARMFRCPAGASPIASTSPTCHLSVIVTGWAAWLRSPDRYIHPLDGKLRRLIVQSTDKIFDAQGLVTWPRTYVRKVSPLGARLATWPNVLDFSYNAAHCKYHGDAKVWRNLLENCQGLAETIDGGVAFTVISVEEWYAQNTSSGQVLEYLFVAYSTEQFRNLSDNDMKALHNIAVKATKDAGGTIRLSRLELAILALKYRLSERYVCLLPKTLEQPWHCMDDQYECSPWDIEPQYQVARVCHDDTVILDGAHGACIRWKSFRPVWAATGPSFKRICAQKLMEMSFVFFVIAVALFAVAGPLAAQSKRACKYGGCDSYDVASPLAPYIVPGVMFFLIWITVVLLTPMLVRIVYGGKFHNVQARFFGIEGYLNPPTVERAICPLSALRNSKYMIAICRRQNCRPMG